MNLQQLACDIAASKTEPKISEEQVTEVINTLCDLFVDNPRLISTMIQHGYHKLKDHDLYPSPGRGAVGEVRRDRRQ